MQLGIASEGVTDQQTIENILIGYFKGKGYRLSSGDVLQAQPSGDATDHNNKCGYGSWTNLLGYLRGDKIKEDVDAFDFLILQIDSDVCDKAPFNVPLMSAGKDRPVVDLVSDIVIRLVQEMNLINTEFYENHKEKIIFAISVHSIECWIYKYFEKDNKKATICKTKGCEVSLNQVINKKHQKLVKHLSKKGNNYFDLTKDLRQHKNLQAILNKDKSFEIFYGNLDVIPIPKDEDDDF